jgi:hypothetical protein
VEITELLKICDFVCVFVKEKLEKYGRFMFVKNVWELLESYKKKGSTAGSCRFLLMMKDFRINER